MKNKHVPDHFVTEAEIELKRANKMDCIIGWIGGVGLVGLMLAVYFDLI